MHRNESARGAKLSKAIVSARKKSGLTQEGLARRLEVSNETIRKIEKGSTSSPGFFLMLDMSQIIDLDIKKFFKPLGRTK